MSLPSLGENTNIYLSLSIRQVNMPAQLKYNHAALAI